MRLPFFPLLVLAAVLLVTPLVVYQTKPGHAHYALVIDCGSSGTRIYAYTWFYSDDSSSLPTVEAIKPSAAANLVPRKLGKGQYTRVETQPGLDQYVGSPEELERLALGPLLAWARAVIPRHQRRLVPLFLLATAGVRRLPPEQQSLLLQHVRRALARSGFSFRPEWAKIISGQDEGVYGWIAINYLQGLLDSSLTHTANGAGAYRPADAASHGLAAGVGTLGALDLGGSSLEMTYALQPSFSDSDVHAPDERRNGTSLPGTRQVVLGGASYSLVTHTFQRYGLNDAYDRSISLLLRVAESACPTAYTAKSDSITSTNIYTYDWCITSNPCLQDGDLAPPPRTPPPMLPPPFIPPPAPPPLVSQTGTEPSTAQSSSAGQSDVDVTGNVTAVRTTAQANDEAGSSASHSDMGGGTSSNSIGRKTDTSGSGSSGSSNNSTAVATASSTGHTTGIADVNAASSTKAAEGAVQGTASEAATSTARTSTDQQSSSMQQAASATSATAELAKAATTITALGASVTSDSGLSTNAANSVTAIDRTAAAGLAAAADTATAATAAATSAATATVLPLPDRSHIAAEHEAAKQVKALAIAAEKTATADMQTQVGVQAAQQVNALAAAAKKAATAEIEMQVVALAVAAVAGNSQMAVADDGLHAEKDGTAMSDRKFSVDAAIQQLEKASDSVNRLSVGADTSHDTGKGPDHVDGGHLDAMITKQQLPADVLATATSALETAVQAKLETSSVRARLQQQGASVDSSSTASSTSSGNSDSDSNRSQSDTGSSGTGVSSVTGGGDISNIQDSSSSMRSVQKQQAHHRHLVSAAQHLNSVSISSILQSIADAVHFPAASRYVQSAPDMQPHAVGNSGTFLTGSTVSIPPQGVHHATRGSLTNQLGNVMSHQGQSMSIASNTINKSTADDGPNDELLSSDGWLAFLEHELFYDPMKHGTQQPRQEEQQQQQQLLDMASNHKDLMNSPDPVKHRQRQAVQPSGLRERSHSSSPLNTAKDASSLRHVAHALPGRVQEMDSGSQARRQALQTVATVEPVVRHPCLHLGYSAHYQRIHTYGVHQDVRTVRLAGAPDWHACNRLVERVVHASAFCGHPPCILGTSQPPLQGKFMALTGFYVVWSFLKLPISATADEVVAAARNYCQQSWPKLQSDLGDHVNIERYCMWGPYVTHLLQQGLGLSKQSVMVGSGDLGWPLGAALAEGLKLAKLQRPLAFSAHLKSVLLPWTRIQGPHASWQSQEQLVHPVLRWGLLTLIVITAAWALLAAQEPRREYGLPVTMNRGYARERLPLLKVKASMS